jgi:hypothetical protein
LLLLKKPFRSPIVWVAQCRNVSTGSCSSIECEGKTTPAIDRLRAALDIRAWTKLFIHAARAK